jgi:sugar lactone lactonase YvrE
MSGLRLVSLLLLVLASLVPERRLAARATMPAAPLLPASALVPVARSYDRVWDAVAVAQDGRIFVQYPPMTGDSGPKLAEIVAGQPHPYPDASGRDASVPQTGFVHPNGLSVAGGALWVLDSGIRDAGQPPVPGGAKLVRIDLATNRVTRIYPLGHEIVHQKTVLAALQVHDHFAYLADSGMPAIVVLDLRTGHARRFLDHEPSLTARRPITIDGKILRDADGRVAAPNIALLALSPDGQWLYYQPPCGPLYRVGTELFTDPLVTDIERQDGVTLWHPTDALGGMATGPDGTLYFADLATHSILSFTTGRIPRRVIMAPALDWPGNLAVGADNHLYVPVLQRERMANFNSGTQAIRWPLMLYRIDLPAQ